MDKDENLNALIDKRIKERFEDVGIDTSSTESRFSYFQDMLFLRKMRENKQDVSKSFVKVMIDRIINGIITLVSCALAALFSYLISSGLHK